MNYIFTNARILSMDAVTHTPADSVLVHQGVITTIGSLAECIQTAQSPYETIDLNGRYLLPAFTDTHTHFVEFAKRSILVDIGACTSIREVIDTLKLYRDTQTELHTWILGGFWDRNIIDEPESIKRQLLDSIFPDIPVALQSKDYHSKWCNSLALRLSAIDAQTPDPYGGRIERDANGDPTGILYETAAEMIDPFIHPLSDRLIIQAIKNSVNDIYKLGLVAFHSMESEHSKDMLMQSQEEGTLFRCCWHIPLDDLDRMITAGVRSYTGNEFMKTGGVKIFGDGSLGSQTAAMFDHYPSDPSNFGILRYDRDELFKIVSKAAKAGISSTIHAIGDRTVRTVIDVISQTRSLFPEADLMHRIEHVQTIQPTDLESLKACGAYCALQPVHLANDIPMIEKYWQSTRENPYPFKSMVDHGIPHGFGSDAPIETINSFHGIYSALYRKHNLDPDKASWMPHQRIDLMSALEAYTIGAAKASRSERLRGSIQSGKYADLIVLDDWAELGEEYWLSCRSRLTMINGCIVFSDL